VEPFTAIATAVSYEGGFLDSTIEGFHDLVGLSSYGRLAVHRNGMHMIYDLKGSQMVMSKSAYEAGISRSHVSGCVTNRHRAPGSMADVPWKQR
jgi:hypothetical protein